MIRSMTASGNARAVAPQGSITIEFRTVNSRFLDVNFRLPEDLRMLEGLIREQLSLVIKRGKVEVRAAYARSESQVRNVIDQQYLASVAEQLQVARRVIPDLAAPRLMDLI